MPLQRDVWRVLALAALVNLCLVCVPTAHAQDIVLSEEPLAVAVDAGGEDFSAALTHTVTHLPTSFMSSASFVMLHMMATPI